MNPTDFQNRKNLFSLPPDQIYFCGHSLGPMPHSAHQALNTATQEWENHAVAAWSQANWIDLPKFVGCQIAPLIGARPGEVIVADSTSVNLYKCLLMALAKSTRLVVLAEADNFPTDVYIVDSLTKIRPLLTIKKVPGEKMINEIDDSIAVVILSHVNYRSGKMIDIKTITQKAHECGALVIVDLSHSVGALPISCNADKIDFAVGCTYKYLNGGPGSPSFIFVHQKHLTSLQPILIGWMGHKNPFAFSSQYEAAAGIHACLIGTPHILSLKALSGALSVFQDLDLSCMRQKSMRLSEKFILELKTALPELECISPEDPKMRGNHVAFKHPQASAISRALIEHQIRVDYREPNLIRFGFSALYQDETDIDAVIHAITHIMQSGQHHQQKFLNPVRVT